MSTATWTTTPIPAHLLAVGDRVDLDERTFTLVRASDWHGTHINLIGEDSDGCIGLSPRRDVEIPVYVPDVPVDGYGLFKPRPGWSPLGCTCLSRRGDDRNWTIVATDPDCYSHGIHDNWED